MNRDVTIDKSMTGNKTHQTRAALGSCNMCWHKAPLHAPEPLEKPWLGAGDCQPLCRMQPMGLHGEFLEIVMGATSRRTTLLIGLS